MGTVFYIFAMIVVLLVGFIVTIRTMVSFNKKHYSKNT